MGASTTENSAGGLKRTYAKDDKDDDEYIREYWPDGSLKSMKPKPKTASPSEVVNKAKPPSDKALEDNPNDSPLVRAAKKRQRAQREAMKMKQED